MKCARQVKMWDLAVALRWISSYRDVFCVKISAANRSPSWLQLTHYKSRIIIDIMFGVEVSKC